jgi:hypothetical protein
LEKDFHNKPGQSNTEQLDDRKVTRFERELSPIARARLAELAPESLVPLGELQAARKLQAQRVLKQMYPAREKPRRLPESERKARKRARSARKNARRLERLRQRIAKYAPNARPNVILDATWALATEIKAIPTPEAVCRWLRNTKNKIFAALVRHAALGLQPDGSYRYTWEHPRARYIAALAIAIFSTAKRVTTATGKKRLVCRGVPLIGWQELLANPWTGELPGEKTVGKGRHRPGGCLANGQIGYIRALQESGAMYAQKVAPSEAAPFERAGFSGYACLRYWIVSPDPDRARLAEERARFRQLRKAELQAEKADLAAKVAPAVHTTCDQAEGQESAPTASSAEPRPPP